MIKKLFFRANLLLALFFISQIGFSQATANASEGYKTVVYKIKKPNEQNSLTPTQVINIDKLLSSKKGIIASNTNGALRLTSVKLEKSFPEVEIKKLLGEALKLEVESYETINNSN